MRGRRQIAAARFDVAAHVPMGAAWVPTVPVPGTDEDIRGYIRLNSILAAGTAAVSLLCTHAHSPPCCFLQRFP